MNVRKIDSFFNHFNLKKNIYNVLFRAKKEDFIYQALEKTPFKIYNNLPSKYSRHQEFYKPDHIFIEIEKVEEFDQFSAKIQTEEALSIFESFIRYNHHKHNFEIDNQVLVLDDETSKVYKINEEMSGILKQPDKKIHSITKNTTKTFMLLKNLNASPELVLALKAHADAIRTDNVNHQFITLWTAIESMISVTGQKKNINNFIDALEPIFTLEYFFKYTYNLHNYLLKHYNEYKDILKKVPEGDTLFQKSVLLLALKTKNEPIRRELYKIISQNNPILCHKIYYLVNLINNNKSLYDGLKKHRKYIEWQIQRIYRARNIIVHSNKPIFYLNSLIENLHEYFDRIIDTIIRTSELNPHISSLSGIFYHLKIKSDHYLKILNTKDTINIDKKNFKRFILNEFNV